MAIVIGMDEAGYGPNLGPLVVSATAWRVEDSVLGRCDLYRLLKSSVVRDPNGTNGKPHRRRIAIADSKVLYSPGQGLRLLERGLLPCLSVLGLSVSRWSMFWDALAADPDGDRHAQPWHDEFDLDLPLELNADERDELANGLSQALAKTNVQLVAIRSRAIFPGRFNALVVRHGNKATALSRTTLGLLAELLDEFPGEPVVAICDKHGGRNFYRLLLQEQFPDWLVEVHAEARAESVYRFGPREARVEVRFRTEGESQLATALASMASKYLRELAMRPLNDFWCARVANLKPTAGYPGDSRRFKAAIAAVQRELEIEDTILWRER